MTTEQTVLAGATVIRRIRALIVWTLVAGLVYTTFMSGGTSGCTGAVGASGGFVGADGEPTDVEPMCWSLALRPSLLVVLALAGALVWGIGRVLERARNEDDAVRILGNAAMTVLGIALGSLAIGHVWFWMLPVEAYAATGTIVFPFPFASVDAELTPLTQR